MSYEIRMEWQLEITLYSNWNLHTNTHYTHSNVDVVNINTLTIKYNNNNNLHGLMWYELTDRYTQSPLVAQFMVMIFSSSVAYSNDNIRLKFLFGSYIPRRRLESVITSTGFTPVWWLTATHTPQNIRFIRAGAKPTHNPHYEDNYANNCNSMFSNRDGVKEAKLT